MIAPVIFLSENINLRVFMPGLNLLSLSFTIKHLYEPFALNTTFLMAKQELFIFLSRFSCKANSKLQISQQLKGQCQI